MNLARFTVKRPVFTTMATLIVMLLGGISLMRLPVDLMPDITYPTLSVLTRYENASPEEIEELVTRPIEQALSAVPGVEEVSSVSSEGSSSVRVTFTWGTDLDSAANDVRDRLDRILARLPDDADRPTLRKFDLAAFPILILGASGDLDPIMLRRMIEDQVQYRIERVPGVASLDIWGGLQREIQVDLDLDRVRALSIPLNQVLSRIRAANVDRPAGTLRDGHLDLRVRVPGYFESLESLAETVILEREGETIRLGDVAHLRDAWEKPTRIVRVNGRPGVRLAVSKQSGTHTVAVAQGVLAEIERINRDLPQIQIISIVDSSRFIQRSITNVGNSAMFGGVLAIFVLLFFLRDLRATTVIAAAIPVSIVATFAMIYFNGFTLNLMTLGGLALGIGMLVDNAIVVLENTLRLRAEGRDPENAAMDGAGEVSGAILASTLTTLVVFLPLVFVQGMAGVMFTQLAMVVSFALLCSLAAASTLVPMLASRLLRRHAAGTADEAVRPRGRFMQWSEAFFNRLETSYRHALGLALDRRWWVLGGMLLLLAVSVVPTRWIGAELMPEADEGEVRVNAEMQVGTHLDLMERQFLVMEEIIRREVPEIESMVSTIGGGSPWRASGGHTGMFRISLVPLAQRRRSSEEVAAALRPALSQIPGVTVRARVGQGLFIMRMATAGGERLAIEIRGHDFETADALAGQVEGLVAGVEGVTDVQISRDSGVPERRVRIDRIKAADLGLTVQDVAQALEIILGGVSAGQFREAGNEYRILVQASQAEFLPLEDVLDMQVINRLGEPIVLRNVVTVEPATGPVMVERKDRERTITVAANISGRDLSAIVADVREALSGVAVPQGFSILFGGDYEEQQTAFRELALSFILALLLVYMVMACQFESLRDPLVVMFSVPLAAVGVIAMLWLSGTTFNVQSFIGCIMLAGIVVNNAILLVDHANLLRRRDGLDVREAIEESGRRRLRPILMTASTTMLGLTPLALGIGEGGEAQAPMARAVIGGLLSATGITLFIVPIGYLLINRRRRLRAPRGTALLIVAALPWLSGCRTTPSGEHGDAASASIPFQSETNGIARSFSTDDASVVQSEPEFETIPHDFAALSIQEATLLALAFQPGFRLERLRPALRQADYAIAQARFDPTVAAQVGVRREERDRPGAVVDPLGRPLGGATPEGQRDSLLGGVEIGRTFSSGARVDAGADVERMRLDRDDDNGTVTYGAQYRLRANQPLLRDAGRSVQLARLRQARIDIEISDFLLQAAAEQLVAEVERSAWQVALADRRIAIVEESLRLAEAQRDEVGERIAIGRLPEIERAAVEAEVAQRREALINARSALSRARLTVLALLGSQTGDEWTREVGLRDAPETPDRQLASVEVSVAQALTLRPELGEARLRRQRGELEVVRTRNGLLPRLDAFVALGYRVEGEAFGAAHRDSDPRDRAVEVGLRVEHALGARRERAQHRIGLLGLEQAEIALRNLETRIQAEVRGAHIEAERTFEQISATEATRRLREATFEAEREKLRVGKSTSLLVAQAQRDLLAARLAEVEAVVHHLLARIELYRMEGSLLARRGISVTAFENDSASIR